MTRTERGFLNPDPAWLPENEVGIPRDSKERPLIVPPGGTEPVPYERISRVGGWTDTLEWLMDWRLGHLALGMARNPDLCWQAAAFDDWNDPRMRDLVETAHDRAGGNLKANYGTAMHAHTDPGAVPEHVPTEMREDALAYHLAMEQAGVTIVRHEVFVVDDELQVAGTVDTIALHPALGLHVADKKTGHYKAMPFAIQLACYAHSSQVDMHAIREGVWADRVPLGVDMVTGDDAGPVNLERAVVAHIPKGGGSAKLRKLDIKRGREAAHRAVLVHADQVCGEWTDPEPLGAVSRKDTLTAAIEGATCRADLTALHANAARYMTKAMLARMRERWATLR